MPVCGVGKGWILLLNGEHEGIWLQGRGEQEIGSGCDSHKISFGWVGKAAFHKPCIHHEQSQRKFITTGIVNGGAFYLFIANFFATQIMVGAKELVVLLWLSGDI